MIPNKLPPICLIVSSNELSSKVEIALKLGISWIQYREKELSRKEIFYSALKIRELTFKYNALLTINDYLDIAIACQADGVHLGQDDLPLEVAKKFFSGIIGISTHSLEEALKAQQQGAHYIGFGPIFRTSTKKDALEPRGCDMLSLIQKKIAIPVVAIGGIYVGNIEKIIECGCTNIAVSSGILSGNIEDNIEKLKKFFNKSIKKQ